MERSRPWLPIVVFTMRHLIPPSRLLISPSSVPAYTVCGSRGSTAIADTACRDTPRRQLDATVGALEDAPPRRRVDRQGAVGSNASAEKYVDARPRSAGCQLWPPFVLLKSRFVCPTGCL